MADIMFLKFLAKNLRENRERESWEAPSYVAFSRIPQLVEVKTFHGNEKSAIRRGAQTLKERRKYCRENEGDGDTRELAG